MPRPDEPELPISVILVAGLSLVHLVMAAKGDALTSAVIDVVEPVFGTEPALLAATATPWLPLVASSPISLCSDDPNLCIDPADALP